MVEIASSRYIQKFFRAIHIACIAIFILFISSDSSGREIQDKPAGKRRIDLRHADEDIIEREQQTGKDWHRLRGNVFLEHNEITLKCDSAYFYPDKNQVNAFSRIHIEQGDTLDIMGDYLFYDGASEIATLTGNAELINKETTLLTNSVNYDVRNEIARYSEGGKIINAENTLSSRIGIYDLTLNTFYFKDSVRIVNPDYILSADTMNYNTETETAIFAGPSEMKGDSLYLYCEKGWYDTKNNTTSIWQNAVIDNMQQIIRGDSLFYNEDTGYGQSFGNVTIADTNNNIIVGGNYAWYFKYPERFMVTDSALFTQISDSKDSLFLHADTISAISVIDTAGSEYRLMRAYYSCKIFSKDLQGKCDSLSYSFRDSVIRFYEEPVLWSKENQLTSDSVALFTKNRQAERIELYNSAFVVSQVDSVRFNQIKGRSLTGYFKNNDIYKIDINGNGESIYYLIDGDEIIGINTAKCSRIEILIDNGNITDIFEYQNPEGVIDPPSASPGENTKLDGFTWHENMRPKKMEDIFKNPY
ncbi:MAG: organic solvent tolerance protein OstA [Bacteroidetes bacterium]|jgi:lipopolysaccharide export system protein LptA|nr:organic solvent tolerance protein OstA [Bacteroidota bacterium]